MDLPERIAAAGLAAETRRFFHRRQRQPHVITGYFEALHVRCTLDG
ncbi:hypothetical protein DMH02_008785 [Streptomyces sp. WAC 00631]|nr:hypothetical protein [Streptomyces sp. WAC 00631]MCC5033310.1 hypothetical protein [Streptomyces sp. WAC 00631]